MSYDEELLARAAEGDQSAVIALYEQHRQAIYTYVYYRVGGDDALAEDLVADVFVRLVEQLPVIENRGRPLLAWLYTVARHRVADHYRRAGRMQRAPLEEADWPAAAGGLEPQIHRRLEMERLARAVGRLTGSQSDVILLRFVQGLSVAETAALLNKKEGAIKALTRRGLAALRRALDAETQGSEG